MFTAKDQARLAQLLKRKQGSNGEEVRSKKVDRDGAKYRENGSESKSGSGIKNQNGDGTEIKDQNDDGTDLKQIKEPFVPVSLEAKSKELESKSKKPFISVSLEAKSKELESKSKKPFVSVSLEAKSKELESKSKKPFVPVSLEAKSKKLTEVAKNRLAFSRFRSINEYLYSNPSSDVTGYMDEDTFKSYHSAYSILASKWPVKPIDAIIRWMEKLYPSSGKGQIFADMGCGDKPIIAEHFTNATVYSFDLYSTDERIIKSSISSLPVQDLSCHCLVFSLSLMNTNLGQVMKEAARILKPSGHLIIAEVASRFQPLNLLKDGKSVQKKGKNGKSVQKKEKNEKSVQKKEKDRKSDPKDDKNGESYPKDDKNEESDPNDGSGCDSVNSFSRKLQKHFSLKLKRIEYLKPNDYFVIMDFVKVKKIDESEGEKKLMRNKLIAKIPEIKLNPCLYKPR